MSRQHQEVALLPRRPDFGTEGRPIRLKANFYKLDLRKIDYIFHYDVDIKPEKTPSSECRQVVKTAIDKYVNTVFDGHRPAFDGSKNLYSRKRLPAVDGDKGVSMGSMKHPVGYPFVTIYTLVHWSKTKHVCICMIF